MDTANPSALTPVVSWNGKQLTYVLIHPGASYLSLHITTMDIPSTCTIRLSDEQGQQIDFLIPTQGRLQSLLKKGNGSNNNKTDGYDGILSTSIWSQHVLGDTMHITISCKDQSTLSMVAFEVDEYVAGYPSLFINRSRRSVQQTTSSSTTTTNPTTILYPSFLRRTHPNRRQQEEEQEQVESQVHRDLSICGKDDKKNAICYQHSFPSAYEKSKTVARLFINGSGACTGSLIGPNNILMTNAHCISTQSDALNTEYEFMVQAKICHTTSDNNFWAISGERVEPIALLYVNHGLDVALIQLGTNSQLQYPVDLYGYVWVIDKTGFALVVRIRACFVWYE